MRIASLHVYPVKGARAVDLDAVQVKSRGLAGDRRWLFTDEEGVFLTQRTCARLAQIDAVVTRDGLRLSCDDDSLTVVVPENASRRLVTVWNDQIDAVDGGDAAARWLSSVLGRPARIVYMDGAASRTTSGRWGAKRPVSFADAYPILIANKASLDALNEAIAADGGDAVPMARFRPNVVIEGADPWAEDFWKTIRIGDVEIDVSKPCDRCVVTTLDQGTGKKTGREPLKTLHKIRRSAHPDLLDVVLFGWNCAPLTEGEIKAGDVVEITETRPQGWPLA